MAGATGGRIVNEQVATLHRWEDLPREELKAGVQRRLVSAERMMIAHVYFDEGAVVPRHEHENEQLTYILEGCLRFRLGEDESQVVDVRAGEVLHIPSGLPHSAEALEATLDCDIFCPPRQDWLDGTDAYLRNS
jgi:unsaturated pyranuronate lyase